MRNNQDSKEHTQIRAPQPFEANDRQHIQTVDTIPLVLKQYKYNIYELSMTLSKMIRQESKVIKYNLLDYRVIKTHHQTKVGIEVL